MPQSGLSPTSLFETSRNRILIGTTGSGKTYKLRELLEHEWRCFCFDPGGDEHLETWGVQVTSISDAIHLAIKSEKFRIRLHHTKEEVFDFVCGVAMRLGECTVAVDEVALYCSAHALPENLAKLIRLGRKERIELNIGGRTCFIGTTQRPSDIHNFILSQCKEWYIFQMHLPQHIAYLRGFVPDIEKAITLKQGEYLLWNPENREMKKPNSSTES